MGLTHVDFGLDNRGVRSFLVGESVVEERGLSCSDKDRVLVLGFGDSAATFSEDFELQDTLILIGWLLRVGLVKKMGLFVSDFGMLKWTSRAVERDAAIRAREVEKYLFVFWIHARTHITLVRRNGFGYFWRPGPQDVEDTHPARSGLG